jgi:hypothetical protein
MSVEKKMAASFRFTGHMDIGESRIIGTRRSEAAHIPEATSGRITSGGAVRQLRVIRSDSGSRAKEPNELF